MTGFLGIQPGTSVMEKSIAGTGAAISIFLMTTITHHLLGNNAVIVILPSMGAAAVLLFAIPHGPLSQPWALFCGNLISAFIGVCCAKWIDHLYLAAACAVGGSIIMMHLTRSLHPPGGATALAAVIGGDAIHALGFDYIVFPTLINCVVIFAVAMVFNNCFSWRVYPASRIHYRAHSNQTLQAYEKRIETIEEILNNLDEVMDVNAEQINAIIEQLPQDKIHAHTGMKLKVGNIYSNGASGFNWSVRQIIDEAPHKDRDHYMIIYKVVEGKNRHKSGSCTYDEFLQWANTELQAASRHAKIRSAQTVKPAATEPK